MATADTVVGAVGALLLVGVMVGVFVYEYNNVEGPDDPLPGIDTDGDIDGDGVPNAQDDDADGDGVPDDEDPELAFHGTESGSTDPAAPGGSAYTLEIAAGPGASALNATVTYEVSAPAPVPRVPNYQVTLLDPDGETVATGQATQEGTVVSVFLELAGEIPADGATYTLDVREPQGGAGGTFDIEYWVIYG